MPNETPMHSADEMTPALRKALVESGAIIPTTPEEVELAESHLTRGVTRQEVEAAFAKLEASLDDIKPAPPFMRLDACVMLSTEELALAARNGKPLDAETMAKIEDSVSRVMRNPRK